ncbi:hypothetical protein GCM10009808_17970 [Microbacterium sediminicola]|uniref:Cell envelope-related transcriptional attenuator domain-containing protein n=1 Tax=Microbacterium sediminicola TaxID=415210 RepID=A0ABN2I980_9MICO
MSKKTSGRRTVARHGALKSPHPISVLLKAVGIVAAVLLVSTTGVAAYAAYDLVSTYATENVVELEEEIEVPPDIGAIEGGVNLFVAGTDACEEEWSWLFGARCSGSDAGGELNDVNMLVHISDEPRRVTVVSFPRDLMLPIPSCDQGDGTMSYAASKQPLNSAFYYGGGSDGGGLACVVKTISQLTGVSIPFAAKITWGGVINVTDAIGGVDVCVEGGISDPNAGLYLPDGWSTVSGAEALAFLRTRYGVGDGSDLGRISNQQQYMSSLTKKLVSEGVLSDLPTLYRLATTAVDNITKSSSLTNPMTLVQIALAVKEVPFEDIVFVQYPTYTDPDDPNKVVPNYTAADALFAALEENAALELTGDVGANDSVVEVATEEPVTPAETATPDPTASATAEPAEEEVVVTLPSAITGSTAAQTTCSVGNLG